MPTDPVRPQNPGDLPNEELQRLRDRVERAERLALVGELATAVVHEIKNPLQPIRGYVQILSARLDRLPEAERPVFERALSVMMEELDRIDGTLRRFLSVARGEDEEPDDGGPSDPKKVVDEILRLYEPALRAWSVQVSMHDGVDLVAASEDELRTILSNVVKNAMEAMIGTDGAMLSIEGVRRGEEIELRILDEGRGLSDEEAGQAFLPFVSGKSGGTGLGLGIARTAAERSGGRIELMPRPDRRGALVRIVLPRASDPG